MTKIMKRVSLLLTLLFFSFTTFGQASCFSEGFSGITSGNDTTTTGSSTQWTTGNTNFPTVSTAYQAGGAVKLGKSGTSPSIGSITSKMLTGISGDIEVRIWVKGWTSIEGKLAVKIDSQHDTLTYAATMADAYEMVSASFTNVTDGSELYIGTTALRAFIDSIAIICGPATPTSCVAPTNVTDTVNANGTVKVTWDAVSPAPGVGYAVAVIPQGSTLTLADVHQISSTNTSYTTADSLADGTYTIYLASICGATDISDTITIDFTVALTPVCPQPIGLTGVANANGTITATWDSLIPAPADGYAVAIIHQDSTLQISDFHFTSNDTTYTTIDSLADGNYTIYVVSVCDSLNQFASNPVTYDVTVALTPVCSQPIGLTGVANANGTITATWDSLVPAPTDGYAIAIIHKDSTVQTSDFHAVSDTTAYTTAVNDSLADGIYTVYIVSLCDSANQFVSNPVTYDVIVALGPCEDVSNLTVTFPDSTSSNMMINWTAPTNAPASGYGVVVTNITDSSTDTTISHNPMLLYSNNFANGDSIVVTVYSLCDLSNLVISAGVSSDTVVVDVVTPVASCHDVTNLVLTDNGDGTFTASWTASVDTNEGYYVMVEGENNNYFLDFETTATTFTSDSLGVDNYIFTISTICDSVNNSYSDGIQDTIYVDTPAVVTPTCDAPTNVNVTVNNNNSKLTVTWTAPATAPADGYGVLIVKTGDTPNFNNAEVVTATTYVSDSLANGSYTVYVFSICDDATDLISDKVTKTGDVHNTTGLNSLDIISAIYPNPTTTVLNVETNINNGNITVTNVMGQTIENINVTSNLTSINVAHLPAGVYQVIYTSNEGRMVAKFIKE